MKWIQSKDKLPEKDKYVLFDFRENPPMYGKIEIYPGGTFITTTDSSGEENSDHFDFDSQWLDETEQPSHISGQGREAELEKCLGELVELKHMKDYIDHLLTVDKPHEANRLMKTYKPEKEAAWAKAKSLLNQ